MNLARGTIALVVLDPTLGHEQQGPRPCVLVSSPEVNLDQRFPLVAVVPLTATSGQGALYPPIQPSAQGIRKASWALCDQVRSVDKRRIVKVFGQIAPEELAAIDGGLCLYLGLQDFLGDDQR